VIVNITFRSIIVG